tara:strand:+ start:136 stop:315 length:180 start_codon:yes stop_codon:yes gene_type:complete
MSEKKIKTKKTSNDKQSKNKKHKKIRINKVLPKNSLSRELEELRKSKGFRELGDMLYLD